MNKPILLTVAAALLFAALPAAAQQTCTSESYPGQTCTGQACTGQPCAGPYQSSFGQTYKEAYLQNAIWPSQYVLPARCALQAPFKAMVNNGWRRQNLLGPHHFNAGSTQLTESGRLKATWIMTQAPAHRRNLFVQQAADEEQTSQRIQAVHEFAATINPNGAPGDVRATHIRDQGRPAAIVDKNFTGFAENQPAPVLPAAAAIGAGT